MKHAGKKILALALCVLTLAAYAPMALASTGSVAAGTTVYPGASTAGFLGTISTGGEVNILSESGEFYYISVGGTTGYVLKSAVTGLSTTTTTAGSTTSTNTAAPAANAGYVTNCDSYVNMRSEPSTSGSKTKVNKNTTLTILSTSGEYYNVQLADGTTGYIATKYVATGTPSAGGSTGGTASADTVMLENPMAMASISKTIYIRKTTDTSTKSSNLVKKVSSAKGKVFTILGTVGSTQFYASYGEYKGYVKAGDFAAVTAGAKASYATGDKAKDKWGEIVKIDGTNIGTAYGKLYDNSIYCNGLNSKNEYYYNAYSGKKNYFYMLSPQNAPIAVLMSHNMQSSKTGGHYLHHIQNAWLGVAKCEKCKESCSTKTSVFQISYEKHTQWQLVAFFEGNATMRNYAAVNYGVTGAAKKTWIDTFLSYSTSKYKGAVLGSAAETDDVMSFITCGDNGSKGGTYLCMLLKGV